MKKKERQDKAEMEKKKLMIKEIRMLEAELIENKNNNKVQLDLTTTAGHELLGKISLSFVNIYKVISWSKIPILRRNVNDGASRTAIIGQGEA